MSELSLGDALADFLDHQRARRRSERTRELYRQTVTRFSKHLEGVDRPATINATRRDVIGFLNALGDTEGVNAGTVALHFRNLRAFFNWLVAEDELDVSPMRKLQPPEVPDNPPPVLTAAQLEALFAACRGRDFEARRDMALLMVFADTGSRLGEVHGLTVEDWNREYRCLTVTGKGDRTRVVAIGDRTQDAIAKYVRARRSHRHAGAPALWLGRYGPLSTSGLSQLVKKRGAEAGIDGLHPHVFRHSFAHAWLSAGGQESDLMMLAGWTSPEMVRRYGRSAAAERARDAHRSLSPVDRL